MSRFSWCITFYQHDRTATRIHHFILPWAEADEDSGGKLWLLLVLDLKKPLLDFAPFPWLIFLQRRYYYITSIPVDIEIKRISIYTAPRPQHPLKFSNRIQQAENMWCYHISILKLLKILVNLLIKVKYKEKNKTRRRGKNSILSHN